jgi:hypothetical protein
MEKDLNARGVEAAKKFLTARGYEILNTIDNFILTINQYGDSYHLVEVITSNDSEHFVETDTTREEMELKMIQFFSELENLDALPISLDKISMIVVAKDKAILRHSINCWKEE